jgi:hypothetical protein
MYILIQVKCLVLLIFVVQLQIQVIASKRQTSKHNLCILLRESSRQYRCLYVNPHSKFLVEINSYIWDTSDAKYHLRIGS